MMCEKDSEFMLWFFSSFSSAMKNTLMPFKIEIRSSVIQYLEASDRKCLKLMNNRNLSQKAHSSLGKYE